MRFFFQTEPTLLLVLRCLSAGHCDSFYVPRKLHGVVLSVLLSRPTFFLCRWCSTDDRTSTFDVCRALQVVVLSVLLSRPTFFVTDCCEFVERFFRPVFALFCSTKSKLEVFCECRTLRRSRQKANTLCCGFVGQSRYKFLTRLSPDIYTTQFGRQTVSVY